MEIIVSRTNSLETISRSLSERTNNALIKSNINTVGDFLDLNKLSDLEILAFPGIGKKALDEIRKLYKNISGINIVLTETKTKNKKVDELAESYKENKKDLSRIYDDNKQISIFYSIRYLDLGKRVINALHENRIFTIKDLILFSNQSEQRKKTHKGIGAKAIKNINNVMRNLLSYNIKYGNIDVLHYINNADYVNLFDVNKFSFESFLLGFLKNRHNLDLNLLKYRLLFLGNNEFKTFEELGSIHDITMERVRQAEQNVEMYIIDYIESFFYSEIGYKVVKDIIGQYGNDLFFIYPRDQDSVSSNLINANFLVFCIKHALKGDYVSLDLNEKKPINRIFVVKKTLIKEKLLLSITSAFDDLYSKDRREKLSLNIRKFIQQIINKRLSFDVTVLVERENIYYEKILKNYILEKYGLSCENGVVLLPINKKKITFLVIRELELVGDSIHFSDLHQRLVLKYPEYDWKEQTVLATLIEDDYAINIGRGLYVYKTKKNSHLGGTICDIAERFLQGREGKDASFEEVVKYIKKHKKVKSESISTMMFGLDKKNRFVKLQNKRVGLSGYIYPDSIKEW